MWINQILPSDFGFRILRTCQQMSDWKQKDYDVGRIPEKKLNAANYSSLCEDRYKGVGSMRKQRQPMGVEWRMQQGDKLKFKETLKRLGHTTAELPGLSDDISSPYVSLE